MYSTWYSLCFSLLIRFVSRCNRVIAALHLRCVYVISFIVFKKTNTILDGVCVCEYERLKQEFGSITVLRVKSNKFCGLCIM